MEAQKASDENTVDFKRSRQRQGRTMVIIYYSNSTYRRDRAMRLGKKKWLLEY